MDDVVAFLNARLDEDEADALEAKDDRTGVWRYVDTRGGNHKVIDDLGYSVNEHYDAESQPWFTGRHIARHDPARVLREAEAKRAILSRHKPLDDASSHLSCAWCSDDVDTVSLNMRWPCPDVLSLAAVWSNHPDYRQEWKP